MKTNKDRVVDYILENTTKLTPDRIRALSEVVSALSNENETIEEPNILPEEENESSLLEEQPFDLSEVQNIQIDRNSPIKTEIIS